MSKYEYITMEYEAETKQGPFHDGWEPIEWYCGTAGYNTMRVMHYVVLRREVNET